MTFLWMSRCGIQYLFGGVDMALFSAYLTLTKVDEIDK
jgi:hypothetical protein